MKHCPICNTEYEEGTKCPNDGATLMLERMPVDPLIGEMLQESYRIEELMASGGMGAVYRGTQIALQRSVAIKTLLPQHRGSKQVVQRFFREAKILSQLNHPGIVNVIDFGNTETGLLYLVMEFLDGKTMEEVIPRDRGLSVELSVCLIEETCHAVGAAHRSQLIHRDLKPSNVFLARVSGGGAIVKILDFGISKILEDEAGGLTQGGQIIGTPGYISPEMIIGGKPIDARADVYALGGILYYMLCARSPYEGTTLQEIITKQVCQNVARIDFEALGKTEAAPLMAVIDRAMNYDPKERYATAEDFLSAIMSAVQWSGVRDANHLKGSLLPPRTHPTPPPMPRPHTGDMPTGLISAGSSFPIVASQVPQTPRNGDRELLPMASSIAPAPPRRRNLWPAVWVGIALLAVVAIGIFALIPRQKTDKQSPAQTAQSAVPANAATAPGVSPDEILIGMSAAFSGPSKELGREMQLGIDALFQKVNAGGGVNGRKLTLVALDDGYEPNRALENMKELVEKRKVFAVLGNVGTPTAAATLPYAVERNIIFFGAFTGADLLRKDPPDHNVFNYRASYAEETQAMVRYLLRIRKIKPEELAVFAQNDQYGDAGFKGVVKALRAVDYDPENILRVGYERNTVQVEEAVAKVLAQKDKIKAIIMVPTYKPAVRFIQLLKDQNFSPIFLSVSFVGGRTLAEAFMEVGPKYGEGVIVTQVVPLYDSTATGVIHYRDAMTKYHPQETSGFVALEGYIAASIFAEAVKRAGTNLTTEQLITTLESIQGLDQGFGTAMSFSPSNHQASNKVWGTILDAQSKYEILEME